MGQAGFAQQGARSLSHRRARQVEVLRQAYCRQTRLVVRPYAIPCSAEHAFPLPQRHHRSCMNMHDDYCILEPSPMTAVKVEAALRL